MYKRKRFFGICLFLFFAIPSIVGQIPGELTTTNNRAKKAFEEALQKYNLRDVEGAYQSFQDAIRHDPDFIEVYIVMGEMFQSINEHQMAAESFASAIEIDPDFFPNLFFYASESLLALGEYQQADDYLKRFVTFDNISENMRKMAAFNLKRCDFALEAIANPVPFDPQNLGSNINSQFDEYAPTLTADEQMLIFTRKMPRQDRENVHLGRETEDFYISRKADGEWMPAENLGEPINTPGNEGAQSISADGMYLYFTACSRSDGHGSCDIYVATRQGDRWANPVNIGSPVNTSSWESQPSISPDGRTLYFTSNRNGNTGRMDIWMSMRKRDNTWSEPLNMGKVINTTGKEMSPFIHPDNRTLYFASNGHMGMGGMDIFYTTKGDDGKWQKPKNLGYPINTHADEISLVVSASGNYAYFASEQNDDTKRTDLFFFELYEEARPAPVTYMKGFVYDAQNRDRLGARFELIDLRSGETLVKSDSDQRTGEFLVPIPLSTDLALNVSADGYLFFSENFSFEDARTDADPHLYDIPLHPIREGESVVLRNIFFETDSHTLMSESLSELERLLTLLEENKGISIEIGGHTDNTGSFDYNKQLSENRALSVYNYLVENGIDEDRLSYQGYADTVPLMDNDTEKGKARNRRTEFKVITNL